MKNFLIIKLLLYTALVISSCKKYLDKKPDQQATTPTTIQDFIMLVDNNTLTAAEIGEYGTDDYYMTNSVYQGRSPAIRGAYSWETDVWAGGSSLDWTTSYRSIYLMNVVLNGLSDITSASPEEASLKQEVTAWALVIRAFIHYSLEEVFGQPYKTASAETDLGIPLRLTDNLAEISVRATVQEVYNQVIKDIENAIPFLRDNYTIKNRPSKAAAYAILARIHLSMMDYEKAGLYAGKSLQLSNAVMDFNSSLINKTATNPFSAFAPPNEFEEMLFSFYMVNNGTLSLTTFQIDSNLYDSYHINDWRKVVFFRLNSATNAYSLKTSYSSSIGGRYCGPTTAEMYLTRAEVSARAGLKDSAIADLSRVLVNRYKIGTYIPVAPANSEEALQIVLNERRKELISRGIRWADLRRLNQDSRTAKTLQRNLMQPIFLEPNSPKYAFPIPIAEIQLSGIPQNPR